MEASQTKRNAGHGHRRRLSWRRLHAESLECRRLLAGDAFEPNDDLLSAAMWPVGVDELTQLSIHEPENADYYKWTSDFDGALEVVLTHDSNRGDLDLVVYNGAGVELGISDGLTDVERVQVLVGMGDQLIFHVYEALEETHPNYSIALHRVGPDQFEPNDAVFQAFATQSSFETALVDVVNRGGDADTTGAILGMLAGALYGVDSIPLRWLQRLDPGVAQRVSRQSVALLRSTPMVRDGGAASG